ncbi:MAG: hypothetical protein IMZ55_05185 [Acidobacteria bacterium]|nr:hypothetical protein [Acidobacteriota bacterium]
MANRSVKAAELAKMNQKLGPRETCRRLQEALEKKHLRPHDFSLRDLAEGLVKDGREYVRLLDPRAYRNSQTLVEAASGVDTSVFSNITGQIVYSAIMEAAVNPAFVGDQLCTTVPTEFSGEKIPGIGPIGDKATTIAEGEAYPLVGVSQQYIETPETIKRGLILPITKEAIFFDRTGILMERCRQVGEWLGWQKEIRILAEVLGDTNATGGYTPNGYKLNGTAYDAYQTATPWINSASNPLVDWTDINNAEDRLFKMTDPMTGEYMMVVPDTIIVPTKLRATAMMVLGAGAVHIGGATNAAHYYTDTMNPAQATYSYQLICSPLIYKVTASDTIWYLGNFKRAFSYMENWPITVTQAPSNSEAEFVQDIVVRFKASERGATVCVEPRCVVLNS